MQGRMVDIPAPAAIDPWQRSRNVRPAASRRKSDNTISRDVPEEPPAFGLFVVDNVNRKSRQRDGLIAIAISESGVSSNPNASAESFGNCDPSGSLSNVGDCGCR